MDYETIRQRYADKLLTDKQLDGLGAMADDPEITENCVVVHWITQAQADAIRAGGQDPEVVALQEQLAALQERLATQQQINEIITGGETV